MLPEYPYQPTNMLIINHIVSAIARLKTYLKPAPNWAKLTQIVGNRAQLLDDKTEEVLLAFDLSTAVGVQLSVLGKLLNFPNTGGWSDDQYRVLLKGAASNLSASGDYLTLVDLIRVLWGNPVKVWYEDDERVNYFALTAEMALYTENLATEQNVVSVVASSKASGMRSSCCVGQYPICVEGDAALADASGELPEDVHCYGDSAFADANGELAVSVSGGNMVEVF